MARSIKSLFSWAVDEYYLKDNPPKKFKRRKEPSRIVDIPEDIIQKLIEIPDQAIYAGLRDYTLILFTLDTRTRPKEALSLLIEDFDLLHRVVTIPADKTKTRTSRTLPLSFITVDSINRLIKTRHHDWDNN